MKTKIFKYKPGIILIIVLIASAGCQKTTEYEVLSGKLIGYVFYYEKGTYNRSDKGGVEIVLEGSSPLKRTYSTASGKFEFDHVLSGTYNVICSKEGYCQHITKGFQFVGGSRPTDFWIVFLDEITDFKVDGLELTISDDEHGIWLKATFTYFDEINISNERYRYFIGNSPDVSFKNYISTGAPSFISDSQISVKIDSVLFPRGSELYMIVYPCADADKYYRDINLDKDIYYTVNEANASNVASIMVPTKSN